MANRTYLCGSNSDALDGDELDATELLEARYCLPLLWLTLFQSSDVRLHQNAPLLLTSKEQAIANWNARKEAVSKFLGSPAQEILSGWETFIGSRSDPMFLLNTYELWMMEDQPGDFASELQGYFADLDAIGQHERPARDLAFVIQAGRELCSYPYVGATIHLCGYSAGPALPWPEKTGSAAPLSLSAANFLIEELVPAGRPLDVEIQAALLRARERGLRPFACISANWCAPCLEMFELFADPRLAQTLGGVHLLKLDLEQWGEQFEQIGVEELTSVPVILQLNDAGMATGHTITGDAWENSTPDDLNGALGPFFRGQ